MCVLRFLILVFVAGTVCCFPKVNDCEHKGNVYTHGQSFQDDCNSCTCTNGNVACTKMACPKVGCSKGLLEYADGESFKDDCNTCTCDNGVAACTLMACPKKGCLHGLREYADGDSFKDDCNTCICNDGVAACTLMGCPKKGIHIIEEATKLSRRAVKNPEGCSHNGRTYLDGETFMDDCNSCNCNNGSVGCTYMACPEQGIQGIEKAAKLSRRAVKNPEGCVHGLRNYAEGESFKDDCNTCTCINGVAACTIMACSKIGCSHKGRNYLDGETFMDDCNSCNCNNGSVGCTYMACPEQGCDYNGIRYAVGEHFLDIDRCNDCSCGSGGVVACTEKACI